MTGEQQGPTLDVHLGKCPPYEESTKMTGERKGPTIDVHFREVSAL